MRPTKLFYARYLAKPNNLGMNLGRGPKSKLANPRPTGSLAISLHMIDTWFEPQGHAEELGGLLGQAFTTAEFITRFHTDRVTWQMKSTLDSTLRQRIKYLYEKGYLARINIEENAWTYSLEGEIVKLVPGQKLETEMPKLPTEDLTSLAGSLGLPTTPEDLSEPSSDDDYETSFQKLLKDQGYLAED